MAWKTKVTFDDAKSMQYSKALLRGTFITILPINKKNLKLTSHLKQPRQWRTKKKVSRRNKKTRAEINEIEIKQ